MESENSENDELNLAHERFIRNSLAEGGSSFSHVFPKILGSQETVCLSTLVSKFNDQNKKQERVILLTNKHLFNIKLVNPLNNILVKIFNSAVIRRKIEIKRISAVTVSRIGFEFVIHVADEYDYRFLSLEKCEIPLLSKQSIFYMPGGLKSSTR